MTVRRKDKDNTTSPVDLARIAVSGTAWDERREAAFMARINRQLRAEERQSGPGAILALAFALILATLIAAAWWFGAAQAGPGSLRGLGVLP